MLAYDGNTVVYTALQLLPRLLVRPGELRQARWQDFDLDRREWSLTAKGGIAHLVPLSDKAIDLLQTLRVKTGKTTWVFASPISSGQPISNNTLNVALQRLGYKSVMTAHGFRAMGRTLLAEQLNFPTEIIEMQLAHRVRDVHGRAYNRAQWINERFDMMQQWSEYLDML
jgi:integrase